MKPGHVILAAAAALLGAMHGVSAQGSLPNRTATPQAPVQPPSEGGGTTRRAPGPAYQGPVGGGEPVYRPGGGGPGNGTGGDPGPIGGGPGNDPGSTAASQEGLPRPPVLPPSGDGSRALTTGGTTPHQPHPAGAGGAPGSDRPDPRGRTAGPFGNGWSDMRWENWWLLNRHVYTGVRERYGLRSARLEQSVDIFLGGAFPGRAEPVLEDDDAARRRIFPVLVMLLDHDHPDVRAEAALALGKVAGGEAVVCLARLLGDANAHVRHTALLAMGLTKSPEALPELTRFVLDRDHQAFDRAFAALALGLLPGAESTPIFERLLAEKDRTRDIHAAALYALANAGGGFRADVVRAFAEDSGKDEFLRGAAMCALGRTGNLVHLRTLLEALSDRSVNVRRSGAAGLSGMDFASALTARRDALVRAREDHGRAGSLGAAALAALDAQIARVGAALAEDERRLNGLRIRAMDRLVTAIHDDGDPMVRNFAALSLARVGGTKAFREIQRHYRRSSESSLRAFAALALGLTGSPDASAELQRDLLGSAVDSSVRGAVVIALGLLRDDQSLEAIFEIAMGRGDPVLRGFAAQAVGMIGEPSAIRPFRKALVARAHPELMPDFGLALGMLGDRDAVDDLGETLRRRDTVFIHIQAARALASIADRSALACLAEALGSRALETQAEAAAARALGAIAEKGNLPILAPLARDYNYLLGIESLNEILLL